MSASRPRNIECERCYDEDGSEACIRASHRTLIINEKPFSYEAFTLSELNETALCAGLASPHWNALEKQLAKELLTIHAVAKQHMFPGDYSRFVAALAARTK